MNIQALNFVNYNRYSNIQSAQKQTIQPSFCAASDITLNYVLKKNEKYLPKRIADEIRKFNAHPHDNVPTLIEFHNKVYEGLFNAKTLDEVKQLYPEFKDVLELTAIKDSRSKAVKAIKEQMTLEQFTLQYLKDLYTPIQMDKLVEKYKVPNRSILHWLNDQLHITKLNTNYINLLRMSDEAENRRIAELSRQAIFNDMPAQTARLKKAADAHRTPEYIEKKRQEMIDFYRRNPDRAITTGQISRMTWERCPEIRIALRDFTQEQPLLVKQVLAAKRNHRKLNENQRRIVRGYYKRFWEQHPDMREMYRKARLDVIDSIKKGELV